MWINILNYLIFFILIFLFYKIGKYIFSEIKIFFKILIFTKYLGILNYHLEKAYDIIYKDKIIVYSLEATKPNEQDIDKINKEFILLTIKMIGNKLEDQLIDFYGSKENLLFNIGLYFVEKYEDDSIRKSALDTLSRR